ncbi:unnamed protein product [Rhizophagus irregularis]|nr:unnamed protein product [Rhizophagus irregularis]
MIEFMIQLNFDQLMQIEVVKVRIIENLPNSIAARAHHHPAWVAVAGVSRTETQEHSDGHNYDKAKIGLGVPATWTEINSISIFDDKPNDSNNELRTGQLAIFVRPQWSLRSITHMQDLNSLTTDSKYDDVLKVDGEIRPIWILLMDGGPDENPRFLKNIKAYYHLFKKSDLVICVKVTDPELATQNFRYAGEALCDIWSHDLIFGKQVNAQYVDTLTNPFENVQFEGTDKEKGEELKDKKNNQRRMKQVRITSLNALYHGLGLKFIVICVLIQLI